MRKIASVIILLVLLFNMAGYRAWFYYAEREADAAMEASLDKDSYDENDLISLIVPLHNPYQIEQRSFERVNGEISFQGRIFKYVKRRVFEGKMILLCLPDNKRMILKNAKSAYGAAAGDLANTGTNSSRSGFQKNMTGGDYLSQLCEFHIPFIHSSEITKHISGIPTLPDIRPASPGKPPRNRA